MNRKKELLEKATNFGLRLAIELARPCNETEQEIVNTMKEILMERGEDNLFPSDYEKDLWHGKIATVGKVLKSYDFYEQKPIGNPANFSRMRLTI